MTACPEACPEHCVELLHGLLDGELDAVHARNLEAHVAACPGCAAQLDDLRALRADLASADLRACAPAALRARILADIGAPVSRPALPRVPRRWAAAGLGVAIAASLLLMVLPAGRDEGLERQLIAGHVRSLQAQHLLDVPTSDRHTVKPWFAGKLDYSPPVPDLATAGFPLQGGRLDYQVGRPVAALVYRHGAHVINLYVWPTADRHAMTFTSRDGYNLMCLQAGGMAYWAVSDVNEAELRAFAVALAAEIGR
ncbi:MAG: anti-sigma factor [Azospirillaceae bacterium]|nr:anti-sigma factor [Azospirillaceae bacterium]